MREENEQLRVENLDPAQPFAPDVRLNTLARFVKFPEVVPYPPNDYRVSAVVPIVGIRVGVGAVETDHSLGAVMLAVYRNLASQFFNTSRRSNALKSIKNMPPRREQDELQKGGTGHITTTTALLDDEHNLFLIRASFSARLRPSNSPSVSYPPLADRSRKER